MPEAGNGGSRAQKKYARVHTSRNDNLSDEQDKRLKRELDSGFQGRFGCAAVVSVHEPNTIGVTMEESIELGINAELDHILKPGWSQRLEYENDLFRVMLPQNEPDKSTARAELYSEVWRIARFVAYQNFSSISKNADSSFSIRSINTFGDGYEILFDPS